MTSVAHAPRLAVFDVIGTTVRDDGVVADAFGAALATAGVLDGHTAVADVRGQSKRQALAALLGGLTKTDLRVLRAYEGFQAGLAKAITGGGLRPMAGVERVFDDLRAAGIRIALTTGLDRQTTQRLLEALRWDTGDGIDALVCDDDVANGRPAPDLILRAMSIAGVADPEVVLCAGDTAADLQAGWHARVRWNVGVLSGAHDRRRLESAPHTHIIETLAEVRNLW